MVLLLRDVAVEVGGRVVVRRASIEIPRGEIHLLLGPNASGKTTLLRGVVGYPGYRIARGEAMLDGVDLRPLSMEERVAAGIGIAFQWLPRLRGVRLGRLLEKIVSKRLGGSSREVEEEVRRIARLLSIEHLLDRDVGAGFSGGEGKRVEVATLLAQRPRVALVDEPDSGVDVDSVFMVAQGLEELMREGTEAMLIVTHTGFIARSMRHSRAYVMLGGEIVYSGPSGEVLRAVLEKGFSWLRGGSDG